MTINYHRVWEKMNSLEMVSTKISSAREILDCAVDRLQEHQYDKAETLLYAVDEYLQYYLDPYQYNKVFYLHANKRKCSIASALIVVIFIYTRKGS